MGPDQLPPEIWTMIFIQPGVYCKGVLLNKEWNQYLMDLVLPVYARKGPHPHEVKRYLESSSTSKSVIWFSPKLPQWKEIEPASDGSTMHFLYSWTKGIGVIAERISSDDLVTTIANITDKGFQVDPATYQEVFRQRKSLVRYDPLYLDDALLDYVQMIVKIFDRIEGVKWRLLNRAINALIPPQ